MTFVDCCNKILLNSSRKNVIELAKGSLNNFFQDSFNEILSQQLTHDRSYMSQGFQSQNKLHVFNPFLHTDTF